LSMADASSLTDEQKKKLMINYLPQSVDVSDLRAMFLQFGPISNVHIVKNNATNESKGYGFVTYNEESSSEKAIAALNGKQIDDKRLRVAYSTPLDDHKPKAAVSNDDVNVYIANLPKSWSTHELTEHFEAYGPVKHSKILSDSNGTSRGAGFVRYETSKMAAAAILDMDGKCPEGGSMPLIVKIADGKKKSTLSSANHSGVPGLVLNNTAATLNLNHSMNSSNGYSVGSMNPDYRFNPYSKPMGHQSNTYSHPGAYPPIGSNFSPSPSSHQPGPGAGYMPSGQPSSMMQGYQPPPQHHHHNVMSPQLPVAPLVNKGAMGAQHICVYVGNLPETTCKSCLLYQLFAPYGAIANVKPMANVKPEGGNDHWFAFVNMKVYDDATQAIQALNGSSLNGRNLKVGFKTERRK